MQVEKLYKRFGTLEVIRGISFEVYPNEVVGLAGLSGSGKSVIAKLLAGVYTPNGGTIAFDEKRLLPTTEISKLGIEVIHQYPELAEGLSVTDNIFLGSEIRHARFGRFFHWIDQPRMDAEATDLLQSLDAQFPSADERVRNLSNEQRQLVAIARVLVRPARLIFVDEPILLSFAYQQKVLRLVEQWRQQGKTVIFSSSNLDHLFAVTDRILVLRNGEHIDSFRTDMTNREEIVAAMVGYKNQEQPTPAFWALDSYYRAREKADSLHRQTLLLEKDLEAQGTLNQQLLSQLAEQVKALDQANTALQDAHRRLLTEREQERKHLARELHDQVIQDLLTTNYQLEEVEDDVSAEVRTQLEDVRGTIRQLVDDIRRICGTLRPPTIDSLGLSAALQSYTREWAKRTGIEVELCLKLNPGRLPEAIELSLFRIVQEALSNVQRHAHATHVEVTLEHTSPRTLMVSVADNGVGLGEAFDLAKLSGLGHYGLLGLSERAALLSGHLRIHNRSGGGLLLQVEVSHPRMENPINAAPKRGEVIYHY
ncbi:MAG TPA: ATP-binding cassette domain-containing protein [Phototrophicaceae bacterium]|nr:ATP-binding cassette domain-containing protein [Phototrophicaceae bacterium]